MILMIFLISTDMKVVPNLGPIALGCGDSLSVTAFFFKCMELLVVDWPLALNQWKRRAWYRYVSTHGLTVQSGCCHQVGFL